VTRRKPSQTTTGRLQSLRLLDSTGLIHELRCGLYRRTLMQPENEYHKCVMDDANRTTPPEGTALLFKVTTGFGLLPATFRHLRQGS
jgi:hypothetical protein